MFERLISRIKITFLVAMFLSPVIASAWSKGLDRWLDAPHRFDAPARPAAVNASLDQ